MCRIRLLGEDEVAVHTEGNEGRKEIPVGKKWSTEDKWTLVYVSSMRWRHGKIETNDWSKNIQATREKDEKAKK